MKFQSSQRLPPHQDRRLQLRMLGFVGLIAVAMFSWQAWRISTGRGGSSHPHYPPTAALNQVDFDVEEEASAPLKDDEIRIVPRQRRAKADSADAGDEENSVQIPAAWLADIEDNTVGVRQSEADTFYRILERARTTPVKELESRAEQDALFVNLMTSPEKSRGRLVTIFGEMRKLREITPPKNRPGLTKFYEAWICTAESGENPYRVVCSEIPRTIKPQESCRIDVKVTGYFFKREGYQTQDGRLHLAPTVLAGRLFLSVSPYAPPPVEDMVPWMVGVISVIGLAMVATVIGYAVGDARVRRRRMTPQIDPVSVEAMFRADQRISVEESLRRLEEGELPENEPADHSLNGNGRGDLADELIDLPTPFPPTRVPRRWDGPT